MAGGSSRRRAWPARSAVARSLGASAARLGQCSRARGAVATIAWRAVPVAAAVVGLPPARPRRGDRGLAPAGCAAGADFDAGAGLLFGLDAEGVEAGRSDDQPLVPAIGDGPLRSAAAPAASRLGDQATAEERAEAAREGGALQPDALGRGQDREIGAGAGGGEQHRWVSESFGMTSVLRSRAARMRGLVVTEGPAAAALGRGDVYVAGCRQLTLFCSRKSSECRRSKPGRIEILAGLSCPLRSTNPSYAPGGSAEGVGEPATYQSLERPSNWKLSRFRCGEHETRTRVVRGFPLLRSPPK
jgi:hypothetical protein